MLGDVLPTVDRPQQCSWQGAQPLSCLLEEKGNRTLQQEAGEAGRRGSATASFLREKGAVPRQRLSPGHMKETLDAPEVASGGPSAAGSPHRR